MAGRAPKWGHDPVLRLGAIDDRKKRALSPGHLLVVTLILTVLLGSGWTLLT